MIFIKKIKDNLNLIFTSKIFYMGIIIRIISLLIIFSFNMDLNDMNELLIYAIQRLFSGNNPYDYSYRYLLNIIHPENSYYYHLGYPPIIFLFYFIVILYPNMWGIWDFNIILFILNIIYDFFCYFLIIEKNKKFSKILMSFYWLLPIFAYIDYVTFYSLIFLFTFLSLKYNNNPLKSMLFIFLNIGSYHLTAIMFPIFFIYYLRNYKNLEESINSYKEQIKNFNNIKPSIWQWIKLGISLSTLRKSFQRGLNDLKFNIKIILKNLIIALTPVLIIVIPFIIWDFKGFKYHLFEASAERFQLTNLKGLSLLLFSILILFILISMFILFLIEKRHIALIWLNIACIISFNLLALYLYLSLNFSYPHYFGLPFPFYFFTILVIAYEYRYFKIEKSNFLSTIRK